MTRRPLTSREEYYSHDLNISYILDSTILHTRDMANEEWVKKFLLDLQEKVHEELHEPLWESYHQASRDAEKAIFGE